MMVLDRRLVLLARVSWIDGCTLRLSVSGVCQTLCVVGLATIYACGLIMLSANLRAIHVPLSGHTSNEGTNKEDEGELLRTADSDGAMSCPMGGGSTPSKGKRHTADWVRSFYLITLDILESLRPSVSCLPDQNFSISLVSHVGTKQCEQCKNTSRCETRKRWYSNV